MTPPPRERGRPEAGYPLILRYDSLPLILLNEMRDCAIKMAIWRGREEGDLLIKAAIAMTFRELDLPPLD